MFDIMVQISATTVTAAYLYHERSVGMNEIPEILFFVEAVLMMAIMATTSMCWKIVGFVAFCAIGGIITTLLFGVVQLWTGVFIAFALLIAMLTIEHWLVSRYGVHTSTSKTSEDEHENSLHR